MENAINTEEYPYLKNRGNPFSKFYSSDTRRLTYNLSLPTDISDWESSSEASFIARDSDLDIESDFSSFG